MWRCHSAQRIAREHGNSGRTPLLPQLQGMAHICRGEEIDALAPFDALPHQSRRSKLGTHCSTMPGLVIGSDLGHDFTQAPSAKQYQFLTASRTAQDPAQQESCQTPVDHTSDHSSGCHNTRLLCCKMGVCSRACHASLDAASNTVHVLHAQSGV